MSEDEDSDHKHRSKEDKTASKTTSEKSDQGEQIEASEDRANGNVEENEEKAKQERIAASLKKREAEVAKELSGHLHAREKEREQHRRSEAITAFQALLTDLIKHPDYSWKEAKKVFKKDSR